MRNRYLVAYDVSDAARLRRTHGKLKGFGDPLQYSVFTCDLSRKELAIMKTALTEIIDQREDRVVIIDMGPVSGRGSLVMQTLGRQVAPATREALVV